MIHRQSNVVFFLLVAVVGGLRAESPEGLLKRGLSEAREGKTDQALVTLRSAVQSNPGDPAALMSLGLVAQEARRYEEARDALERAIQRAPASETALYNLAMVYEKLRSWDKARDTWRRFLTLSRAADMRDIAQRHLDRLQ